MATYLNSFPVVASAALALTGGSVSRPDEIAVFDKDFNQLFQDAVIHSIEVREDVKMMTHPVETGATVTDHRIIEPIEISIDIVPKQGTYRDVYNQLKAARDSGDPVRVQTRTHSYENMHIASMPHEETADMWGTVKITVQFKEVFFVEPQYIDLPPRKVANPGDASTVRRGNVQPQAATPQQEEKVKGVIKRGFSSARDLFTS
jgi:hypothetical protein